jgi:cytochrome c peroxidase
MSVRGARWRLGVLSAAVAALVLVTVVRSLGPRGARHDGTAARAVGPSPPAVPAPGPADADPRAVIGRALFFDASLSSPPGTACSGCHDPARGYAGDNGSTRGVPRGSRPGHFARRATPSLLYLRFVRRFHFQWDEEQDFPEARGGFFWDGRADSIARLVREPLFNPDEMNAGDPGALAARIAAAPYAGAIRAAYEGAFESPERTLEVLGDSLEAFLTSAAMAPFSSRYDDYVRGQGDLTPLEKRGLALFKDHARGACSGCHSLDDRSRLPQKSLFTDFGYETLSVPRNRALPADGKARDLGLCGRPVPKWHSDDDRYCGAFRTPSLRNVALRTAFMHDGVFTKLRDVVAFYATRATNPERWYAAPGGAYDDLPEKYWPNVNTSPAPYNRRPGEAPALGDADVDALVAFLETLTDRDIPR